MPLAAANAAQGLLGADIPSNLPELCASNYSLNVWLLTSHFLSGLGLRYETETTLARLCSHYPQLVGIFLNWGLLGVLGNQVCKILVTVQYIPSGKVYADHRYLLPLLPEGFSLRQSLRCATISVSHHYGFQWFRQYMVYSY
jgi:hypothetical protein